MKSIGNETCDTGGALPARVESLEKAMDRVGKRRAVEIGGELIVPAVMLAFVAFYWAEARHLSMEALAFPAVLTAVVVLAAAAVVARCLLSANGGEKAQGAGVRAAGVEGESPAAEGLSKKWMIVLVPVVLVWSWRELGAMPAIFLYAVWALFFLGERRRIWLIGVPSFLAFALVYLFKTVLYVRLPDIPWI